MNDEQTLVVKFDPDFPENDNLTLYEIVTNKEYELINGMDIDNHILSLIPGAEFRPEGEKLVFTNGDKIFTRSRDSILRVYEQETGKVLWPKP
ncbi:MAG: hypothetical protein U9P90_01220 [Patescibacteria group bacterium]|nr:hypothetical protein [Patescibacteria group bacterium]